MKPAGERRAWWVLVVGALIASIAGAMANGESTRRAVLRQLADAQLQELAFVAGIDPTDREDERFDVQVVQGAGSVWVREEVQHAVEASSAFRLSDGPHAVRVEVIELDRALALQLRLSRRGWDVRGAVPARGGTVPWVAWVCGVIGAVVALRWRRAAAGVMVAGVLAQLLLSMLPPPPEILPPLGWWAQVQTGPMYTVLVGQTESLSPFATALLAGLAVTCLVLVGFDHKSGKGQENEIGLGSAGVAAFLFSVGGLAWVEAAWRAGAVASLHGWAGVAAALGVVMAWSPVVRRAWTQRRRAGA